MKNRMKCAVEWKKVPARLMWVGLQVGVVSAYGPGSDKSEEAMEDYWNEFKRLFIGMIE